MNKGSSADYIGQDPLVMTPHRQRYHATLAMTHTLTIILTRTRPAGHPDQDALPEGRLKDSPSPAAPSRVRTGLKRVLSQRRNAGLLSAAKT
jgi:hypothetical protein